MFDEIQRDAIRAEAQALLQRFSEKLKRVNINEQKMQLTGSGMRGNEAVIVADSDFRDLMFENAAKKDGDFIIGETKKW